MAVCDESSHQIDRKVGRTAKPRMLDMQQVLELVKHGFHQGPAPKDDLFVQQEQAIGHGALEMGDQADAPGLQQLAGQRLRQVPFIAKQAAPEPFRQLGHRTAVIEVPGRRLAGQQFAVVVDHELQLEATEPAQRGFTALGQVTKHAMLANTAFVADRQRGGVHERAPATGAQAGLEIGAEGPKGARDEFHKALVADGVRELATQMP